MLKDKIRLISGLELIEDKDLTSFTTFRLSSRGDLIEVFNEEALQQLLPLIKGKYIVVGWGANQILPVICEGFVLHLKFPFDSSYLDTLHDQYNLPASLGINHLTGHASRFGIKGWEVFTGVPASLGGAIYMNAGTNLGEIGKFVKSVRLMTPDGEIREELIGPGSFSYRKNHFVKSGEVIISANLGHEGIDTSISGKIKDYLEYRKKSQPLTSRNCGCVFKNPARELQAGRLIDSLGLKDLENGKLKVSYKHGNFIENSGGANWDQFKALVDAIKFEMDHFYGIEFELEVKIPYH